MFVLGCAATEGTTSPSVPSPADPVLPDSGALESRDSAFPAVDGTGEPSGSDASPSNSSSDSTDAGDASSSGRQPGQEVCNNGIDDDLDGLVDQNCPCTAGTTQTCYFGPKEGAGNVCPSGVQTCSADEFPLWGPCQSTGAAFPEDVCECYPETCDNGKDDNCNGQVDEGCSVDFPVDIDGDCVTVSCPAYAPYPVGCDLTMEGGDSRGCVASAPGSSEVYFQEGDACPILGGVLGSLGGDVGHISGKLLCSSQQGPALDAKRCSLNKQEQIFPTSSDGCP
jgi:hypothetical protein